MDASTRFEYIQNYAEPIVFRNLFFLKTLSVEHSWPEVRYPNVRWFDEKGKWNKELKTYCEEHLKETIHSGQHHLYSRLLHNWKFSMREVTIPGYNVYVR